MMNPENYYTIDGFMNDLEEAEESLDQVVMVGDSVRLRILKTLKSQGIDSHPVIVGSTNHERLTAVIDPQSPDDRYLCDFDIVTIVERELEPEHEETLLKKIFPHGKTKKVFGRLERHTHVQKFPVSIILISADEATTYAPVVYTERFGKFPKDVAREIRALRLFANRSGLYGGYTKGFKGIALERMAIDNRGFENTVKMLYQQLMYGYGNHTNKWGAIRVANPVDTRQNLVNNVQCDIWRRTFEAAEIAETRGLYRATPYMYARWKVEHPEQMTMQLQTTIDDPYKAYKQAQKFVMKTLKQMNAFDDTEYAILVIPHMKYNEVLLAVDLHDNEPLRNFRNLFRRRWDSMGDTE